MKITSRTLYTLEDFTEYQASILLELLDEASRKNVSSSEYLSSVNEMKDKLSKEIFGNK